MRGRTSEREREGYICALYLLELCVNFIAVFEGGGGRRQRGESCHILCFASLFCIKIFVALLRAKCRWQSVCEKGEM